MRLKGIMFGEEYTPLFGHMIPTHGGMLRISRLNEIYREELIEHRKRQGTSVDNLIGLSSLDPYSEPTHRRAGNEPLTTSSSAIFQPQQQPNPLQAIARSHMVPIPRPSSAIAIHRPPPPPPSSASSVSTSSSFSPSSPSSPSSEMDSTFPRIFSPSNDNTPFSLSASQTTPSSTGTTPPSSSAASLSPTPPAPWSYLNHQATTSALSYPSVPPPSLSSSPIVSTMMRSREPSVSHGTGNGTAGRSRNTSRAGGGTGTVERGGRIAETGSLVRDGRSRAGSASAGSALR